MSASADMAAIVKQAGDLFEQIVLCGDPLFLKKLCDYSQDIGLDWRRYRLNAIIGEKKPLPLSRLSGRNTRHRSRSNPAPV